MTRHALRNMFVSATALATAVVLLSSPWAMAGVEAGQSGSDSKKPAPGAAPVVVTNDATHSVPVTLEGTPTVTLSGTPTVTIAGTPIVALSGTPTVNANVSGNVGLTGTPAVTVSGVLTIQDLTDGMKELFSMQGSAGMADGEFNKLVFASPPVPAGKRFVIEHVSSEMLLSSGTGSLNIAASGSWYHDLALRSPQPFVSQMVKFYVDGGQNLSCGYGRTSSVGGVGGFCSFSGYLVNLP